MKNKDKSSDTTLPEVRHFTSSSPRAKTKGIVVEKVRPGSETARFMERMEIHRLKRPCQEPIDLRGKVTGTVRAYFYSNVTHWLDDASHRIFRDGLSHNRGVFTVGTFETIVGHRHVVDTKPVGAPQAKPTVQKAAPKNPAPSAAPAAATPTAPTPSAPAAAIAAKNHHEYFKRANPDIVPFGYYRKRKEERYVHALSVELGIDTATFKGQTVDFSFHGLQLVLDEVVAVAPDSSVEVRFRFDNLGAGEVMPCTYRAVAVKTEKRETLISLTLDEDENSVRYGKIKQFFDRIARRAKVDALDDVITTRALAYQHFYSASLGHAPMFFRIDSEGRPWIEAIARTPSNEHVLSFFATGADSYDFSPLRIPSRIAHLCLNVAAARFSYDPSMPDDRPIGELNLIVFRDLNGNLHSVAEHEIGSPGEWTRLLRHALIHHQYRVFKLLVVYIKEHHHEKSIRSTIGLAQRNLDAAKTLVSAFRGFIAVGQLSDVTLEQKTWLSNTLGPGDTGIDLTALQTWVNGERRSLQDPTAAPEHSEALLAPPEVRTFGDFVVRREDRYIARTKAEIEINGIRYQATTRDLSVRGLSLYVDDQVELTQGQGVAVGLLSFGKKTYNFDLRNMRYRVVNFSHDTPTLIQLEREKDADWDDITEFFKEIIAINQDKLSLCLNDAQTTAKARLFEDIYSSHVPTIPFFVARDAQGRLYVRRVVVSEFTSELADFFYLDKNFLDYRAMNDPAILKSFEKALAAKQPSQHTLYFYKEDDRESGKTVIRSASNGTLGDYEDQVAFIRNAFRSGEYRFMSVRLAPVSKPKSQLINPALDALRDIAAQDCSALDGELAGIVAVGEMLDITRDVRSAILG